MADGWKLLGDVLGGGIDREGARAEGIAERDAGLTRRAKTEEALARARIERDKAVARERLRELDLMDPSASAADLLLSGVDYNNFGGGALDVQRFNQRALVADPATSPDVRHATRSALYSDPSNLTLADELTEAQITSELAQAGSYDALAQKRLADPVQAVSEALPDLAAVVPDGEPVQIANDADFDALPSGAMFIDPNGQLRRKP